MDMDIETGNSAYKAELAKAMEGLEVEEIELTVAPFPMIEVELVYEDLDSYFTITADQHSFAG